MNKKWKQDLPICQAAKSLEIWNLKYLISINLLECKPKCKPKFYGNYYKPQNHLSFLFIWVFTSFVSLFIVVQEIYIYIY